jgi:hypothetical protein
MVGAARKNEGRRASDPRGIESLATIAYVLDGAAAFGADERRGDLPCWSSSARARSSR